MSSIMDDAPADARSLDSDRKWSLQPLLRKAERSHQKMPGIRKIPLRAIAIILFIALLNAIVWIAAAIVLVRFYNPLSLIFDIFSFCFRRWFANTVFQRYHTYVNLIHNHSYILEFGTNTLFEKIAGFYCSSRLYLGSPPCF